jgi:hypothetical protein
MLKVEPWIHILLRVHTKGVIIVITALLLPEVGELKLDVGHG